MNKQKMRLKQRAMEARKILFNRGISQYVAAVEVGVAYGTFRKMLDGEEVFRTRPDMRERIDNWISTNK